MPRGKGRIMTDAGGKITAEAVGGAVRISVYTAGDPEPVCQFDMAPQQATTHGTAVIGIAARLETQRQTQGAF